MEANTKKIMQAASLAAMVALGGAVLAATQTAGSTAGIDRRDYDVAVFDTVSMAGPHHVVITVGPAASVHAEGPRETLDLFEVAVENGALKIQPMRDQWWDSHWPEFKPATYYVTLPRLSAVALAGSGRMKIDRVEAKDFRASVSGSGQMDIALLAVDDANFSVAGSGDLIARGRARQSELSVAGSGNLRAREVTSNDASISIAGSGNVELTVQNDARVSIIGSGDVNIAGSAKCSVSRLGSGHVRCGKED